MQVDGSPAYRITREQPTYEDWRLDAKVGFMDPEGVEAIVFHRYRGWRGHSVSALGTEPFATTRPLADEANRTYVFCFGRTGRDLPQVPSLERVRGADGWPALLPC